jgi:hypothetical protein
VTLLGRWRRQHAFHVYLVGCISNFNKQEVVTVRVVLLPINTVGNEVSVLPILTVLASPPASL